MFPVRANIFLSAFTCLLFFLFVGEASSQNVLCAGSTFSVGNVMPSANGCGGPNTYEIQSSTAAGVTASTNPVAPNTTFTPTGTGQIVIQINNSQGDSCTVTTFSVVDFSATMDACSTMDFAVAPVVPGVTYTYNIDGVSYPNVDVNGVVSNYNMLFGGPHTVSLTMTTSYGSCTTNVESVTAGGPDPQLSFTGNNFPLNQESTSSPDSIVVPFCANAFASQFNLGVAETPGSNANGTNVSYSLNGSPVTAGWPALAEVYTLSQAGYVDYTYSITDNHGCTSTMTYSVFLFPPGITPNLTATPNTQTAYCLDDIAQFLLTPGPGEGIEYDLIISCDAPGITTRPTEILAEFSWFDVLPPSVTWTPTSSSCGCDQDLYWITTYANHPCDLTPDNYNGSSSFAVGGSNDPDFSVSDDTPCVNQNVQFTWNGFASNNISSHCNAAWNWTITGPNGNVPLTFANGQGTPNLNYTFTAGGNYNVCLTVQTLCDGTSVPFCEDICVTPLINAVVNWNLPASNSCPPVSFNPNVTLPSVPCDQPVLTWILEYSNGTSVPTSVGTVNNANSLTPSVNITAKGSYRLRLNVTQPNCITFPASLTSPTFTIAGPPIISTTPPAVAPCPGSTVAFQDLFCVNDCYSPLTNFSISLYSGNYTCATIPGNAVALWSSSVIPTAANNLNCIVANSNVGNAYTSTAIPMTNNATYTVRIIAQNGCGTDTECFTFTSGTTTNPAVTVPAIVCPGSVVDLDNLTGFPGNGYSGSYSTNGGLTYTPFPSGNAITVNDTTLIQIMSSGGCSQPLTSTVNTYTVPNVAINYTGTPVCNGQALNLNATVSGGTVTGYQWYLNSNPVSTNPTYTITTPVGGTIIGLTVSYGVGCTAPEPNVTVQVATDPGVINCPPSSICANAGLQNIPTLGGPGVVLTALTLDGVNVMGNTTFDPAALVGPNPHTLVYTYTANGCTHQQSCAFNITTPTNIVIVTPNVPLCVNAPVQFTTNPVTAGLTWSSAPCPACINSSTGLFTPNAAGSFSISVTGPCIVASPVNVQINALPTGNITSPAVTCGSNDLDLAVTTTPATNAVSWYIDATVDIPISDPFNAVNAGINAGNYSICAQFTDANQCIGTACYPVQITSPTLPLPVINCSPDFAFMCPNSPAVALPTATLNAWVQTSFTLNNAPVTVTDVQVGTAPFTVGSPDDQFQFAFVDPNGCTYNATCDVNVEPNYSPTIATADFNLCPNETLDLNTVGTTGGFGQWTSNNGSVVNATSGILSAATPGNYTATFSGECINTVTQNIVVVDLPTGDVTMPAVMCTAQALPLSGTTNAVSNTVSWTISTTPVTTITSPFNPSALGIAAGNYNICMNITNTENCTASVCEPIQINSASAPPTMNCNPLFAHLCLDTTCLNLPTINLGVWTLQDTLVNGQQFNGSQICAGTAPFVISANPHVFQYALIDPSGCTTSINCNIAVFDNYNPAITSTPSGNDVCEIESVDLNLSLATGGYGNWSVTNGSITSSGVVTWADVNTPIIVTASYGGYCIDETSYDFTVNPNPAVTANPVAELCINETLTLSGTTNPSGINTFWEWDGNALTGATVDPDALGMTGGNDYEMCFIGINSYQCGDTSCYDLDIIGLPSNIVLDPNGWHCISTPFTNPNVNGITYTVLFTHDDSGNTYGPYNNSQTFTFTESGDYSFVITITSTAGCTITQNGTLQVLDDVVTNIDVSAYNACAPEFDILNTSTGIDATWAWTTNLPGGFSISNTYLPAPASFVISTDTYGDQTYFITLTGTNLCSTQSETVEVEFVDVPEIFIAGSLVSACSEFNSTIVVTCPTTTVIDDVEYTFNNGWPTINATDLAPFTQTFNSTFYQEVLITAEVCNACGCDVEEIIIEVYPPDTEAEFTAPTFLCPGESGLIDNMAVGPDNMLVSWSISPNNGTLQIGNQGGQLTLTAIEAAIPGVYTITQTASSPECGESVHAVAVTVGSMPILNFTYPPGSICAGGEICFQNQSSNYGSVYWNFGIDDMIINDVDPCYVFNNGGTYTVTLFGNSPQGCEAIYQETVQIFGPNATIQHADSTLCVPGNVVFWVPQGEYQSLVWNLILPDTTMEIVGMNPLTVNFDDKIQIPFLATVNIEIVDIFGCVATSETQVLLKPGATAYFEFDLPADCALPVNLKMINLSSPNSTYIWIHEGVYFYGSEPTFRITDNNEQIELRVTNVFGCKDDHFDVVNCETTLFVPNAVTPDDDGINDVFKAEGEVKEFKMWIFDRWGEAVFYSENINEPWIVNYRDGEYYVKDEAYTWLIHYVPFGNVETKVKRGHVVVIR